MPIRSLPIALQKKAAAELNEVSKRTEDDLKHIKEWIAKQSHLKARTDDQWLLSFLRGCKFSLQKTKEKLDLFYTMRSMVPEFFKNRDPFSPEIQEVLKRSLVLILPKTANPEGPRIMIIRVRALDPDKILVTTAMKVGLMAADILMNEDDTCVIAGQQVLLDLQDLPYKYIKQITPVILRKMLVCIQNAYPSRLKGFYFINAPAIFETMFVVIKKMVRKKIASKFKFRVEKDFANLSKTIPLSVLPKEYGGHGDSIENLAAEWKLKFENYRDWFLEDAEYYSDETKRTDRPRTSADMFGIEGSFRKLEID